MFFPVTLCVACPACHRVTCLQSVPCCFYHVPVTLWCCLCLPGCDVACLSRHSTVQPSSRSLCDVACPASTMFFPCHSVICCLSSLYQSTTLWCCLSSNSPCSSVTCPVMFFLTMWCCCSLSSLYHVLPGHSVMLPVQPPVPCASSRSLCDVACPASTMFFPVTGKNMVDVACPGNITEFLPEEHVMLACPASTVFLPEELCACLSSLYRFLPVHSVMSSCLSSLYRVPPGNSVMLPVQPLPCVHVACPASTRSLCDVACCLSSLYHVLPGHYVMPVQPLLDMFFPVTCDVACPASTCSSPVHSCHVACPASTVFLPVTLWCCLSSLRSLCIARVACPASRSLCDVACPASLHVLPGHMLLVQPLRSSRSSVMLPLPASATCDVPVLYGPGSVMLPVQPLPGHYVMLPPPGDHSVMLPVQPLLPVICSSRSILWCCLSSLYHVLPGSCSTSSLCDVACPAFCLPASTSRSLCDVACPASTMFLPVTVCPASTMLPVQPLPCSSRSLCNAACPASTMFLPVHSVMLPVHPPPCSSRSLCDVACSASTVFLPVTLWCCLSSLYHVLPGHSVTLPVQPLPCSSRSILCCCLSSLYRVPRGHSVMLPVQPLPCSSRSILWCCLYSLYHVLPGHSVMLPVQSVPCSSRSILWCCLSSLYHVLPGHSVMLPVQPLPCSSRSLCDVACPASTMFFPVHSVMLPVLSVPCSSQSILWCCLSSLYRVPPGHSVMLPVQSLQCSSRSLCNVACPVSTMFFPVHSVMLPVHPLPRSSRSLCDVACPASTMFFPVHSVMLPVQSVPCSSRSLCDVACPPSTTFFAVTLWCCLSTLYHVLPGHSVMLPVQPLPRSSQSTLWCCLSSLYHVLPGPLCVVACPASNMFFPVHSVMLLYQFFLATLSSLTPPYFPAWYVWPIDMVVCWHVKTTWAFCLLKSSISYKFLYCMYRPTSRLPGFARVPSPHPALPQFFSMILLKLYVFNDNVQSIR